jgi:hypothetical protein
MRAKWTCPECKEQFTRHWNLERHLYTMHHEEYGFLRTKPKEGTELQNQFAFPFRKPAANNIGGKSESPREYLTKKIIDLMIKEVEGAGVDNDLKWESYLLYELQSIKNEIQSIKNILLNSRRY